MNFDFFSHETLVFMAAAIALIASPGPATISLAGMGAAFSFQNCRPYLFGTICSATLVSIIVAGGLLAAMLTIPYAAIMLLGISTVVMLYIAYRIGTASSVATGKKYHKAPGFIAGFLINVANPKAYVSFAAPLAAYELSPRSPAFSAVIEVVLSLVILAITNTLWLFLGKQLKRILSSPIWARCLNVGFSLLMLIAVLGIFLWSMGDIMK
ncbi:MAG: hypothetical protein CL398_08560 [Acidiferrobacteraceae bacterium]|mgnify:CR=1 FL=1|nr:hypothetical protein [Acidiferrobacteraceae bacterium]